MNDAGTVCQWIVGRIGEALDQADLARAAASDLDDPALVGATLRLAEDLEAFAISLAGRLCELGDEPAHTVCPVG
jgi:hypothetical protein